MGMIPLISLVLSIIMDVQYIGQFTAGRQITVKKYSELHSIVAIKQNVMHSFSILSQQDILKVVYGTYGVVVSTFVYHHGDRCANPGLGSEIWYC